MKKITIIVAFSLIGLCFAGTSLSTPPGKHVSPLSVKVLDVKLIPLWLAKSDGKPVSVTLVWIPHEILKACDKKTVSQCHDLDHDRRKDPWKGGAPTRILIETVEDAEILYKASKLSNIHDVTEKNPVIDISKTVRAKVRWELWPNGENFTVVGSQRKTILDALRKEVYRLHKIEVVFVVNYLEVKNGWAWIQTAPQSPDGKNKYEDISALMMQKKDGTWMVAELPCGEEENPDCIGDKDYFKKLRSRFPQTPPSILPRQ